MDTEPTVLARWTGTVIQTLHAQGHDGAAIARRAGIDPEGIDDEGARLPLSASTRLWRLAVEATGNPLFGLDVARHVRPSTFAGLSMGVVTSASFRDALDRSRRFGAIVLEPAASATVVEDNGHLVWTNQFRHGGPAPAPEAMEAILAAIVLSGRFLLGRSFSPVHVALCRNLPATAEQFREFFGCPVRFGADGYHLRFAVDDVDRPLRTGAAELAAAADRLAHQYMDQLETDRPLSAKVRAIIAQMNMGAGPPGVAEIASELAVSPRTLQRRLRAEDATVRELTDQVQADLARRLLVDEGLTAEQTAARLGFHDASSFRRAFRRWTGTTPQGYSSR